MRKHRQRSLLAALGAVALGATVAFALPAGADVRVQSESPPGTIKVANEAKLNADGTVEVRVAIVCWPGGRSKIKVNLAQPQVGGPVRGYGEVAIGPLCTGTGTVQTGPVTVKPLDNRAFRTGAGRAVAQLEECPEPGCRVGSDTRRIRIV